VSSLLLLRPARAQGEKWASEFERTRKFAGEEKKKNLTDHGFRYTSYPKKSSGLGNYYGTIGGRHLHEGEKEAKAPPAAPAELEPRQVQTMPAKKGRFNTPGISFGCPQPKGVAHKLGKEFEYQSDPYNTARKLEMEMRAASKKARQPQPFKSMSRSADYFDETKTGIASRVYEAVAMPALKEAPPPPARASDKPFYPSKPAKSGSAGMLNKFPAHMEDPESEKFKKELERKQAERAFGSWHYQEWGKTAPTRSVLFHHPGAPRRDRRDAARPIARPAERATSARNQPGTARARDRAGQCESLRTLERSQLPRDSPGRTGLAADRPIAGAPAPTALAARRHEHTRLIELGCGLATCGLIGGCSVGAARVTCAATSDCRGGGDRLLLLF
jgi:hypothetical protein